jgi:hypothetical protein
MEERAKNLIFTPIAGGDTKPFFAANQIVVFDMPSGGKEPLSWLEAEIVFTPTDIGESDPFANVKRAAPYSGPSIIRLEGKVYRVGHGC